MKKLGMLLTALLLLLLLPLNAWAEELLVPVGKIVGLQLRNDTVTVAAFDDAMGSLARDAGLRIGDEILKAGERTVRTPADVRAALEECGGSITLSEDTAAVAGADVVYTDVWVSMGEPVEVWEERINALAPYQVNAALMAKAKPGAVFMHCLPAYHDHKTAVGKEMGEKFGRDAMEVTDEVFNGPQSIVFQEAENRMHTIKAVMAATLGA